MALWPVFRVGGNASLFVASNMARHSPVLVEYLHHHRGELDLHLLAYKMVGNRVEVLVHCYVVVDVDLCHTPASKGIPGFRKRLEGGLIKLFEQFSSA